MALWGKMERGKMAPCHITPKVVSFGPYALVRLPHAHSTHENATHESG